MMDVVRLNAAIKTAAPHFETLPRGLSKVAFHSKKMIRFAVVRALCCYSVVAIVAKLALHCSAVVNDERGAMLDDLHARYGVCGHFMIPSTSFPAHVGDTVSDRPLQAPGT